MIGSTVFVGTVFVGTVFVGAVFPGAVFLAIRCRRALVQVVLGLSLIHISEPTRPY